MKRRLVILFASTAFVSSTAIAEWPKIIVHEHSLAYNYPGSEYELIEHGGEGSNDESSVNKPVSSDVASSDNMKSANWPKIIVHEHSLAYNYPGSEYELIPHAGTDSNNEAGVENTGLKQDKLPKAKDSSGQDAKNERYN